MKTHLNSVKNTPTAMDKGRTPKHLAHNTKTALVMYIKNKIGKGKSHATCHDGTTFGSIEVEFIKMVRLASLPLKTLQLARIFLALHDREG